MAAVLDTLSRRLKRLQALAPESRLLRCIQSFVILALDLGISIASFGFQPSQQRPPRRLWSPLAWYYGLRLVAFFSILMLPYTWALTLVEILCSMPGEVNGLYFPRRARGYLLAQYLLWFFTGRLANQSLNNLSCMEYLELEAQTGGNSNFDRVRKSLHEVLCQAPFTSFSLASVLSVYLLYDAINLFRNPDPSRAPETDSILGLFLPPIFTFLLGFLVLQVLPIKIKCPRQTLPSHSRL